VVAIEEPESHLHPKAIRELRSVIEQLGTKHQVVLTTHCPLFVSRRVLESNIVVNDRKARPATDIEEIREVLGVRAADNLIHAELVLVVEGEDDRISLDALLRAASLGLQKALDDNRLAIDTLGGGSNLAYKVGLLRDAICDVHCLLDYDSTGREAYERAKTEGLISDADVNFTICKGMAEAEFEDLLAEDLVEDVLTTKYRITTPTVSKAVKRAKWSSRMGDVFANAGKSWTDRTCAELKLSVAVAVATRPATALNVHRRAVFDALVAALESRLG
jgi:predicted ATP-dependent endonuclease of OLD family